VKIENPTSGAYVNGTVEIEVYAIDWLFGGIAAPPNRLEFYIDGENVYTLLFIENLTSSFDFTDELATPYNFSYLWNTQTVLEGKHFITVKAYDSAENNASDFILVTVDHPAPPAQPVISVGRGKVEGLETGFRVNINVTNAGYATANDIEIVDKLRGYQALPGGGIVTLGTITEPTYDDDTRVCEVHLSISSLLPQSSKVIQYYIVPILFEDDVSYQIGIPYTQVSYKGPDDTVYNKNFIIPATQVEISPGDTTNVAAATNYAIGLADYLIVTHPSRLFAWYKDSEVNVLLSEMAHLAYLETGVLGYLESSYTESAYNLDDLIEPDGDWAKKLSYLFSTVYEGQCYGYMLIVGETEIVPAWNKNFDWWVTNKVKYSDHRYADTTGGGAPNLIVGRIIGSGSAANLTKPIQVSINVHKGSPGYGFDRSDALVVSGTGDSYKVMVATVNKIENMLKDEGFNVEKIHWKDYVVMDSCPFAAGYEQHNGLAVGDIGGDAEAEILIADRGTDKVYVYNPSGTKLEEFTRDFKEGDGFAVGDVMGDDKEEILIADYSADRIDIYKCYYLGGGNWDKGYLGGFDINFHKFDGFAVGDVMGDDKDEILIADRYANKVHIYDVSDVELNNFSLVTGDYQIYDGFAVGNVILKNPNEEIVIADRSEDKIYTYAANGTLLANFSCNFVEGYGFAIGNATPDSDDEIVIANFSVDTVYYFTAGGSKKGNRIYRDFDAFDGFAVGNIINDEMAEMVIGDASEEEIYYFNRQYEERMTDAFVSKTPNKDVICIFGHGSPDAIWPLGANDPYDFPLDFSNANPFIFAISCLTGDYQSGDDSNFAEAFFDSGAAVYIGSTEESSMNANAIAGKEFAESWGPLESIAQAFTNVERNLWSCDLASPGWRLWVWEYNIYGDPKYGRVPSAAIVTAQAKTQQQQQPLPSLQVDIPDYEVTTRDGLDYVEISGGHTVLEEGKPQVPYYGVFKDYPAGYEVQDVVLTNRSGLVNATGLNLPVTSLDTYSSVVTNISRSDRNEGWYPEEDYYWEILENPDGSTTLVILMYPFYYSSLTTDVEFYKTYDFAINYTVSNVTITSLSIDKHVYRQGEKVIVDFALNNSGEVKDVIVNAVIKRYTTDEIVSGLNLHTLGNVRGEASFSSVWDSASSEPDYYYVEVTLEDTAGNVQDRKMEGFRLGISSGEITGFTATPEIFDTGDEINISMTFNNAGTVNITGNAIIKIINSRGDIVEMFEHNVTNLIPSENVSFCDIWDTSEAEEGSYEIVGYVSYDSKVVGPVTAVVSTGIGIFDTCAGTYPSISGTHTGTITPSQTITVSKLYTYSCTGTGGHTEHVTFYYSDGTKLAEGHWTGYTGEWHNITFDTAFTLYAGETYNYTIRTGSYPQIIHEQSHTTLDGSFINCTEFTDANGRKYNDWIPAIRLWA
ncbi:MAG: C25 family cysteine peptidase, partial [Euryarchaeota archaeon]|nr:C25 family cysteine peptidase [Euryarchaeota archaeon]